MELLRPPPWVRVADRATQPTVSVTEEKMPPGPVASPCLGGLGRLVSGRVGELQGDLVAQALEFRTSGHMRLTRENMGSWAHARAPKLKHSCSSEQIKQAHVPTSCGTPVKRRLIQYSVPGGRTRGGPAEPVR
jgi:hypothetical protein